MFDITRAWTLNSTAHDSFVNQTCIHAKANPCRLTQPRLETLLPSKPKGSGTRTKVCLTSLEPGHSTRLRTIRSSTSHAYTAKPTHAGSLSPVLKHCCHQSRKAPEHGPRCVCHHLSLDTQLDCARFVRQPDMHTRTSQPMPAHSAPS